MKRNEKETLKTNYIWAFNIVAFVPLTFTLVMAVLKVLDLFRGSWWWVFSPIIIELTALVVVFGTIALFVNSVKKASSKKVCIHCVHSLYDESTGEYFCCRKGDVIRRPSKHSCSEFYGSVTKGYKEEK